MVERLVHRFIKNTILMKRPLFNRQYTCMEGRCTDFALHYLVAKVEEQMGVTGYSLATSFNIQGHLTVQKMNSLIKSCIEGIFPKILLTGNRECWPADP